MPTDVLMPALSPTMEEGKLSRWVKKVGDTVKAGDVLAEIETDKATMEIEAADDGTLTQILVPDGTEGVKVNTPIAILSGAGEGTAKTPPPKGQPTKPETGRAGGAPSAQQASPAPEAKLADGKPGSATERNPETGKESIAARPEAKAAPAQPKTHAAADPDLPTGTEMVTMTVREALRDAMAEEMRRDKDVFVMGEEVGEYQGAYKVTQGLLDEFGHDRVVDTPITEYGFAGVGVGAAFAGLRPIVEFMTWNFAMQAIDHIVNSAAKTLYMSGGQMGCPIVFRGPNGAAARVGAQHSQDFAAWYSSVPGMKVVQPYSAADAKGLLKAAIRDPNPVVFLENEILYGQSFEVPKLADYVLPLGKARIARTGKDVTLVTWGIGMTYALKAADELAGMGVDAEILDLRSLRPLDLAAIIESVKKTNRCVVVEEAWPVASLSSYVASEIMTEAFDFLDAPVIKVTGKDVPMPYAANLEKLALPSVKQVIDAVKAVTYR
jgi:pyruvate dehydrogenase E1 component beta subunit